MKISVVGTGYVGLVSGVCLSEVGHTVTCVDIDEKKIDMLRRGECPIFEPGLSNLIKQNVGHERLYFSTDLEKSLEGARAVFIAVGTPEDEDGSADLSHVKNVASAIGDKMTDDLVIIVKSTVPVSTCDIVEEIALKKVKERGVDFKVSIASNPEFLKEGAAISDSMKPDRIIVGVEEPETGEFFKELYGPFIMDEPGKLVLMDRHSSEMTKYASNAMLAARISFMNEMSVLCEKVGANVDNVRRGMGADPRIGRKFLYAGPGYGGSCFPKDVEALVKTSEKYGVTMHVLAGTRSSNVRQKQYVAEKLGTYFGDLKGKKVALWGLTFKPGTDDVRESPAKTIVDYLLKKGAEVVGHDPQGMPNFKRDLGNVKGLTYVEKAYDALEGADAMVLVTEWPEYKRPNWEKVSGLMRDKVVFDFRNQYLMKNLKDLGFYYECIGRPDSRS